MLDTAREAVQTLTRFVQALTSEPVAEVNALSRQFRDQLVSHWDDDQSHDVQQDFLRGAVSAAVSLSQLQLSSFGPAARSATVPTTSLASVSLEQLTTSLQNLAAACLVVNVLLQYVTRSLYEGYQLESAAVFRLTSCTNVALGPAAEAAHLAFTSATTSDAREAEEEDVMADLLAAVCGLSLAAAGAALRVLRELKEREPAAALRATVCRPEKAIALCEQCAGVLDWCLHRVSVQGAKNQLVQLLSCLVELNPGIGTGKDVPSSPALASLVARHYTRVCKQLLSQPIESLAGPAAGAAAASPAVAAAAATWPEGESAQSGTPAAEVPLAGADAARPAAVVPAGLAPSWQHRQWLSTWFQEFVHGSRSLELMSQWLQPVCCEAAIAPTAAALQCLLRLVRGGLHLSYCERTICIVACLVRTCLRGLAFPAEGQRQGRQQQQQQQQVPTVCLEAAAVCCSALTAALEARLGLSPAACRAQPNDARKWAHGLKGATLVLQDLPKGLSGRITSHSLEAALAAAEAALRLAGHIAAQWERLPLLPHAEQCGLMAVAAQGSKQLLDGAGLLVNAVAQWFAAAEEQSSTDENSASGSCGVGSSRSSTRRKGSGRLSAAELATLAGRVASMAASAAKVAQVLSQVPSAPELALNEHWYIQVVFLVFQVHLPEDERVGRLAQGVLLPLLYGLHTLSKVGLGVRDRRSNQSKVGAMLWLLKWIDARPDMWDLAPQERVIPLLCISWRRVSTQISCPDSFQQAYNAVAKIAHGAQLWQRSAPVAVQEGLLDEVASWAAALSRAVTTSSGLNKAWAVIETVASKLMAHCPCEAGTAAALKVARKVVDSVQQLPAPRQRKQLSSPAFWQVNVRQQLLPALRSLACAVLAAKAPAPEEVQLRVARALATRVCANPSCLNLRGCCEARLRSRRCSGCGVARYCGPECQVADLAVHSKVCQQLGSS